MPQMQIVAAVFQSFRLLAKASTKDQLTTA
jgi:hypothetical protein